MVKAGGGDAIKQAHFSDSEKERGWGFPFYKKQAQRVIHVHDSGPFLSTSSSLVVFIFVQHLLNQVPRWECGVIATLSEKIDAQVMPNKGITVQLSIPTPWPHTFPTLPSSFLPQI